jgi:hypothetical protein
VECYQLRRLEDNDFALVLSPVLSHCVGCPAAVSAGPFAETSFFKRLNPFQIDLPARPLEMLSTASARQGQPRIITMLFTYCLFEYREQNRNKFQGQENGEWDKDKRF